MKEKIEKNSLLGLMNVGPATYQDFQVLGISTVEELSGADPDELYIRLQEITEKKHDPCVWDIFAAAIDEAQNGVKKSWWEWTKIRKKRQQEGGFCD